jgi:hypothetical protein
MATPRGPFKLVLVSALVLFGCARDQRDVTAPGNEQPSVSFQSPQQGVGPALAAQLRHTGRLMAVPGVVGTAVGLTADGRPAVKIFTKAVGVGGLPATLEGVPVVVEVTGEFFALQGSAVASRAAIDPTTRFARPVPIGVSTGNEGQCSAGTISARVKDAAHVYALSNNHVYALENTAPLGSNVLQPGLFDTGCVFDPADVIGSLTAFEPIVFTTTASNTIDAAIAVSSTANLGNATPANGYGAPNSITTGASLGQAVQKYGRTTSLTRGTVTAINATVNVGYSSGTARFVGQIIVQSKKPFIKPGDSGSLLVTNDVAANPVGLLFAGSGNGQLAVANQIGLVLARFGVSIDGK